MRVMKNKLYEEVSKNNCDHYRWIEVSALTLRLSKISIMFGD